MIKYCRAEYATLALSSGRVRIGTVHGYQRIENSFLRDGSEGVKPYIIAAGQENFILSNAESNAVMQSPGFELINGWKLALPAGARTRLIPSSFNTLVFSMSVGDEPDGAVMRKLGYDSYYTESWILINLLCGWQTQFGKPSAYPMRFAMRGLTASTLMRRAL